MGKLKKIGIGFGIIIGLFFALILAVGISIEMEKADMTPEERQQWEEQRETKALQKEIDKNVEIESETIPKTISPSTIGGIPMEPGESYMITEDGATKVEDDSQLDETWA